MDTQPVVARGGLRLQLADGELLVPGEDRGFKHVHDQARDMLLIVPRKGQKMNQGEWSEQEKWFRSMIMRPSNGKVLSVGWPKFFNHGENTIESKKLDTALENDADVFFTEKYDGSLIVRSVIDGKVHLRTRGMLDGGDHGQAAMQVIQTAYPALADPDFHPDQSLLFEFVSPDFRLVINYEQADLVMLGAVDHDRLRCWDVPELKKLADDAGLHLVETIELPHQPEQLVAAVAEWKDHEGVVARCDHGQTLVKIKGAEYLARHRLRFALSARVIRELCLMQDVHTMEDFEDYIKSEGADWELLTDTKPLVQAFISAREEAAETLARLRDQVPQKAAEFPERKDFAIKYAKDLPGRLTGAAFALLDGKQDVAEATILEDTLDRAFAEAEAVDQQRLADPAEDS